MMRGIITYSLLLFSLVSFAQQKKEKDIHLPKGNKEFRDNNYVEAEADYRISQSQSPAKSAAAYNLGNAIYRQKQPGEAANAYLNAIKNARTKQQKHMAYHNLGNVMMKEKNYQGAVEAYKNALRNNPADEETRYNFALAKKMLKDNPPPKQDQKQDQKQDNKSQQPKDNKGDNKDKGGPGDQKDKGDKGEDKEKKPKEGDNQQEKQNNDKGKPEEKEGPSPSKQRMENLLDAMNNEEKKIQEKMQAKKVKVQPKKQEKDW